MAASGVPSTQTCMNCHSQVKKAVGTTTDSTKLLPLFESWKTGKSLEWVRIHKTPDFAYFNHSAHMGVGVGENRAAIGCETCHGRVDQMVKVFQNAPLTMGWCLDCHRDPVPNMRPHRAITTMGLKATDITDAERASMPQRGTFKAPTNCSSCHR